MHLALLFHLFKCVPLHLFAFVCFVRIFFQAFISKILIRNGKTFIKIVIHCIGILYSLLKYTNTFTWGLNKLWLQVENKGKFNLCNNFKGILFDHLFPFLLFCACIRYLFNFFSDSKWYHVCQIYFIWSANKSLCIPSVCEWP